MPLVLTTPNAASKDARLANAYDQRTDQLESRAQGHPSSPTNVLRPGAAIVGWFVASSMTCLLLVLAAAAGWAMSPATVRTVLDEAVAGTALAPIVALLLVTIAAISHYSGGYVSARLARYNGIRQGITSWLLALFAGLIIYILAVSFSDTPSLRAASLSVMSWTTSYETTLLVWAAILLLVGCIAAILGGKAGQAYHRRLDEQIQAAPRSHYQRL